MSAERREVEVGARHDGRLGTEPVAVLLGDVVNVAGVLEQDVVAGRPAVPEQLRGHEHLFVVGVNGMWGAEESLESVAASLVPR